MCVSIDDPTDGVDVEEVHRCSEDGFEHAVVQRLRRLDQHVEQEHIPDESENDDGQRQTCKNKRLYCIDQKHTERGMGSIRLPP